jgi:hypothetical protein
MSEREVEFEEVINFARHHEIRYIEASSKDDVHVNEIFRILVMDVQQS